MTTQTRYSFYVLGSALMAAISLVLTEIVLQYYQVASLLVIVLGNLVGGGVLLSVSTKNQTNIHLPWQRRDWAAVVAAALCIYTLAHLLSFNAIDRIGSAKTALLLQLETPFVVILAIILLGEQVSARHWIAGALALGGAFLINFDLRALQLTFSRGEIQAMLAPIGSATGIIILKSVLDRTDAYRVTGLALVLGAVFLTPFVPFMLSSFKPGGIALGIIALMGLMRGTSWLIYNLGLKHIGASRSAIIFISFAFFTVMLQAVAAQFGPALGLQLPVNLPAALIGGALIALGIIMLQTNPAQVSEGV